MDKVVLISIPENSLKTLVEQAVKKAIGEIQVPKDDSKSILNFAEGCSHVGISKSHGYKLTSTQQIPHAKRGKRIFFDKAELDNWLLSNKVKDQDQIDKEASKYLRKKGRR